MFKQIYFLNKLYYICHQLKIEIINKIILIINKF
jgi:hypothetical protein